MEQNTLSFEQAMQQLEQILERLSAQDVPLDESIALYAQAASLVQGCSEKLKAAKVQIEEIGQQLENIEEA